MPGQHGYGDTGVMPSIVGQDAAGELTFDAVAQRFGEFFKGGERTPAVEFNEDSDPPRAAPQPEGFEVGGMRLGVSGGRQATAINANAAGVEANAATLQTLEERFKALTGGQPITPRDIPSGQAPFPMSPEAPFGVSLQPTTPGQLQGDSPDPYGGMQPPADALPARDEIGKPAGLERMQDQDAPEGVPAGPNSAPAVTLDALQQRLAGLMTGY